jgi:hypothetical protein
MNQREILRLLRFYTIADHFSGVAGDAAVREEVGRVGEDEVNAVGGHGGEDLEAIAVEEGEVVGAVFEKGRHGDEGVGARTFV